MYSIFFKHFMYATVFAVALCGIFAGGYEIGYWVASRFPNSPWAWTVVPFSLLLLGVIVYAVEATRVDLKYSK